MAQKTLPILNRTGIYQHWDSFWDSNINFTSTFKMHLLVERILARFIENRNSSNHRLITKTFLNKYSYKFGFKTKNYSFLRISKILKKIKRRRKLYIYVGKVTFIKLQSWVCSKNYFKKEFTNSFLFVSLLLPSYLATYYMGLLLELLSVFFSLSVEISNPLSSWFRIMINILFDLEKILRF